MKSRNRGVTSAASEHTMTSNTRSTIIETMARGFCSSFGDDPDGDAPLGAICGPNNEALPLWRLYEEQAEAALTALQAEGMAVVPVEPTARMVIAGASAKPIANRMNTLTAAGVWAAMLAAALPPRSE